MTSTTPQETQTLARRPGPHFSLWLGLWVVVAAVEVMLLRNNAALDTQLFLDTRALLQRHPVHPGVWRVFWLLGHAGFTAGLVLAVLILCRRKLAFLTSAIAATALTGALTWLIAIVAGRFRPLAGGAAGENHWIFFRGFPLGAKNLSFPSGHATLAFATAVALVYFFPRSKWIALPLAAGCAFSRVAQAAHFYGDILFGAALGWTIGWFICATVAAEFTKRLRPTR